MPLAAARVDCSVIGSGIDKEKYGGFEAGLIRRKRPSPRRQVADPLLPKGEGEEGEMGSGLIAVATICDVNVRT
jgi:hypothetical protein